MKNDIPKNIKPNDWIVIGELNAVICTIYDNEPNRIEVVYLDRDRAINNYAHFIEGKWTLLNNGLGGGYADNSDRLGEYVRKLRAGRWWE